MKTKMAAATKLVRNDTLDQDECDYLMFNHGTTGMQPLPLGGTMN